MAYSAEYGYGTQPAYDPLTGYSFAPEIQQQIQQYQQPSSGSAIGAVGDLSDAYQAAKYSGLFGGGGVASGVTAGMAPLGGPSSAFVSSQIPASLGGTLGATGGGGMAAQGLGGFSTGGSFAGAGGIGALSVPFILAMMEESPKARYEAIEKARQESLLAPSMEYLQNQVPAGMSYGEYRDSRLSPETPLQTSLRELQGSDEGDKGYEAEQLSNFNQSPLGQQQNAAWLQQGDNALWYNPDMTRTDYSGPVAPPLSQQRQDATERFGAQNVMNPNTGVFGGGQSQGATVSRQPVGQPQQTMGNIYGQDVPRQTYGGKDLYADQKLFSGNKYKG